MKMRRIIIALLFSCIALFCGRTTSGLEIVKLTETKWELNELPSIDGIGNNVHICWNCWHSEFESKIYYSYSLDGGKTWSDKTCLTPYNGTSISPKIAVNDSTVHVVWKDFLHDNPEIFYRYKIGRNWSEIEELTTGDPRKNNIYDINIGLLGDNQVYLVWKDYRTGSSEIFFKRGEKENWEEDKRLTYDYTPSYNPSVVADGKNLFLVWEDWGDKTRICFMRSLDGGANWSDKRYIVNEGKNEKPDIAVYDGDIYVVWQEKSEGKYKICLIKGHEEGTEWSEIYTIAENGTNINPKVAISHNILVVVWQHSTGEKFDIYMRVSFDSGESWSKIIDLTKGSTNVYDLDLYLYQNTLHMVWQDYHEASSSDICYARVDLSPPPKPSILYSIENKKLLINVENVPYLNLSDVDCVLEIKKPGEEWSPVNTTFHNNSWVGIFNISDKDSGNYVVRAKFINSVGIESSWEYLDLNLKLREDEIPSPGIHLIILISMLLIFIVERVRR